MVEQIPQPPTKPFIGNLLDLQQADTPIEAIFQMADIYGPIFRFTVAGNSRIICANYKYLNELCDSGRFEKTIAGGLGEVQDKQANGLFSATNDDPDWGQAHRILMPAFGPLSIQGMFDEMHDIASQLVMKWSRMGPNCKIDVTEDFTRLTLDTIALCAMDYRFNSFYSDKMHPFVDAMFEMLQEAGERAKRGPTLNKLAFLKNARFNRNIEIQRAIAQEIVERRRTNPTNKKDLLNTMLYGKDPKSGNVMRDELITANMTTFLIAGHETTSGLLSFAFLLLLKNRRAYTLAQNEVDEICGTGPMRLEHLKKFRYLNAVLRETLRLYPTAPGFAKRIKPELKDQRITLGDGEYVLNPDEPLMAILGKCHRDPAVYGEDANEFRPERMLDENFEKLPKNAWKPFGDGIRACIGRAFAWQEALLVVAMLLQRFNFELDDPSYKLRIKQALTIKPQDLYMRATLRGNSSAQHLEKQLYGSHLEDKRVFVNKTKDINGDEVPSPINGNYRAQIQVLYGSNTGTCEALAQKMIHGASLRNITAKMNTMDSAIGHISVDVPLIIVVSSYEGQPPDNAAGFINWLYSRPSDGLRSLRFAVFGCGNSDWAETFQAVPKLVEKLLVEKGGHSLSERGTADAVVDDIYEKFDIWEAAVWPNITSNPPVEGDLAQPTIKIEITTEEERRISTLRHDVREAQVLRIQTLTKPGVQEKRHMEINLPDDMSYSCGDYLAVLPSNPEVNVRRALKYFRLPWHATIRIHSKGQSTLPVDTPLAVADVLSGYVELGQPATKKHIQLLASLTLDAAEQVQLRRFADPITVANSTLKHSLLDLLEISPSINLDFGSFLSMLPPMRVRHYSISSSPLVCPNESVCSITYGVISDEETRFMGVASNHLKSLSDGDKVLVSVRPRRRGFELPLDVESVPLLMLCAGSGLAPFYGFLQERKVLIDAGRKLAPAMLFIGCRNSEADRLYATEIDEFVRLGVVDVRYAFSRESEKSEGCKYVQDRMIRDRLDVADIWKAGAKVYICGTKAFSKEIGEAAKEIARAVSGDRNDETVEELVKQFKNDRIVSDVFS